MKEKEIIDFVAGTSFAMENSSFILRKIFSMTCAYNGKISEEVSSIGGTFTAFSGKKNMTRIS
jgi:hypothetical protein